MKYLLNFVCAGLMLSAISCKKAEDTVPAGPVNLSYPATFGAIYASWPEGFNSGTKTSYSSANVSFGTGSWNLNDALLGTSTSDRRNGAQSVRLQNTGTLTMNFNLSNGASSVAILHGRYGTDANSTWGLWYSTDNGSTWIQTGGTVTTSSTALTQQNFTLNISGNIRFQLRKLSGGRLNIDDFSVSDNLGGASPTRDDHLALGNPSNAVANVGAPNNYLLAKTQYVLSYNNSRGGANWVSWHLSAAWKGAAARCDCFSADASLPTGFFRASTSNYTNTGFDRGHLCPSEDRDGSSTDNAATFLMTNILPQAPNNNQILWVGFENYCRTLMNAGNEVYIISGGYGQGGTGRNGGVTNTIAGGSITVPSRFWKVAVILPVGSDDVNRVSASTRVIAIDTPNNQTSSSQSWGFYRTSVDAIEAQTGLDLLSSVADATETALESAVDNGPTQ